MEQSARERRTGLLDPPGDAEDGRPHHGVPHSKSLRESSRVRLALGAQSSFRRRWRPLHGDDARVLGRGLAASDLESATEWAADVELLWLRNHVVWRTLEENTSATALRVTRHLHKRQT